MAMGAGGQCVTVMAIPVLFPPACDHQKPSTSTQLVLTTNKEPVIPVEPELQLRSAWPQRQSLSVNTDAVTHSSYVYWPSPVCQALWKALDTEQRARQTLSPLPRRLRSNREKKTIKQAIITIAGGFVRILQRNHQQEIRTIWERDRQRRRKGYLFQETGSPLGEEASLTFTAQPSRLEIQVKNRCCGVKSEVYREDQ